MDFKGKVALMALVQKRPVFPIEVSRNLKVTQWPAFWVWMSCSRDATSTGS